MAVLVEVNAGDTVVAHFTLSQSPAHPHSAEISGLKLQNPFTNEAGGMMRQRKGLPSEVANLKYQIFEIAKAGGFTQLRSEGASTFAVNFLYRGIDVITYDDGSKTDPFPETDAKAIRTTPLGMGQVQRRRTLGAYFDFGLKVGKIRSKYSQLNAGCL